MLVTVDLTIIIIVILLSFIFGIFFGFRGNSGSHHH